DELLAHVEPADEVRRNADVREAQEDVLGDAVVDHPLAVDRALLLGVEGGRIILEILDQRARLGPFVEDLGLAFVNLAAAGHGGTLSEWKKRAPRQTKLRSSLGPGRARRLYTAGAGKAIAVTGRGG